MDGKVKKLVLGSRTNVTDLQFSLSATSVNCLHLRLNLFQMILRRLLMVCVSTALTTCVRWWCSRVPTYIPSSFHSTNETTRFITHCGFTRQLSSSSRASFLHTIPNMTNRFVTSCVCALCFCYSFYTPPPTTATSFFW